jgi:hypothetical protein
MIFCYKVIESKYHIKELILPEVQFKEKLTRHNLVNTEPAKSKEIYSSRIFRTESKAKTELYDISLTPPKDIIKQLNFDSTSNGKSGRNYKILNYSKFEPSKKE